MNDYYAGTILPWPGLFVPYGWLVCDGRSLSVRDYPLLHAVIGYAYGGGGDQFQIPNLCGNIPVGADDYRPAGTSGGTRNVSLSPQHLPAHTHALPGVAIPYVRVSVNGKLDNGTCELTVQLPPNASSTPGGLVPKPSANTTLGVAGTVDNKKVNLYTTNKPNVSMAQSFVKASGTATGDATGIVSCGVDIERATVGPAGMGAQVSVMQPYFAMYFIICAFGDYPPRPVQREAESSEAKGSGME